MITEIITSLGGWSWWILGLVLLALEVVLPGTFFLWFGVSALIIGISAVLIDWPWQFQLVGFVVNVSNGMWTNSSNDARAIRCGNTPTAIRAFTPSSSHMRKTSSSSLTILPGTTKITSSTTRWLQIRSRSSRVPSTSYPPARRSWGPTRFSETNPKRRKPHF